MSSSESCTDGGASKSNNDDGVCELVEEKLQKMSTDDNISVCANCGKESSDINNVCNKCKQVKYCNAACKKKHRHKHKKDCEEHVRRAAEKHDEELRIAAELHDIELFKQPPPKEEDCPICFLRLPSLGSGSQYYSCCGKTVCSGCIHAPVYDNQGNKVDIIKQNQCAFCRVLAPITDEEANERRKKRVEANDPVAMFNIGCFYRDGSDGFPQDHTKALEHCHRAAGLGYAIAYASIGYAYSCGEGVEIDKKKANHYYELAAMKGCVMARHNLGNNEVRAGNMDRALKHYMISAKSGHSKSLEKIRDLYLNRHATKDDYTTALRSYQEYLGEIKSVQRDKAAAADESYQYY